MTSTATTALDDLLSLAQPKDTGKKEPPMITVAADLMARLRAWEKTKAALKGAEADEKAAKFDALGVVLPPYRAACMKHNEVLSSVRIHHGPLFVHQKRYMAIPDSSKKPTDLTAARVREHDPRFADHFSRKVTITVDYDKLTPDQAMALGAMAPAITIAWHPNETFHRERVFNDDVALLSEQLAITPVMYFMQ